MWSSLGSVGELENLARRLRGDDVVKAQRLKSLLETLEDNEESRYDEDL